MGEPRHHQMSTDEVRRAIDAQQASYGEGPAANQQFRRIKKLGVGDHAPLVAAEGEAGLTVPRDPIEAAEFIAHCIKDSLDEL